MEKKKIIIIAFIFVFSIVWLFPVKLTISSNNFNINEYSNNSVALLCHGENSTDVQFIVEQYAGITNCPIHIKELNGNSPELFLKRQIDDNYDAVRFLLVGYFDEEITDLNESYSFYVEEWYTVGKITRYFNVFWYPPYGFNIFEIAL